MKKEGEEVAAMMVVGKRLSLKKMILCFVPAVSMRGFGLQSAFQRERRDVKRCEKVEAEL